MGRAGRFLALVVGLVACTATHAQTIINSSITTDTQWTQAGSPYILQSDITVHGAPLVTLTIDAGVEVQFSPGTRLRIGYTALSHGALVVNGTALEPVLFTSTGSTTPGSWEDLYFSEHSPDEASELNYVHFEYGGSTGDMVEVDGGLPSFNNCSFSYSSGVGLQVNAADGALLSNCTFTGCEGYPASIQIDGIHLLDDSNSFSGNLHDAILITGSYVYHNRTWTDPGVPFHAAGSIYIQGSPGSTVLELQDGVELLFNTSRFLRVGNSNTDYRGGLVANGATFGSISGSSSGWRGIQFMNGLVANYCQLTDCVIENSGDGGYSCVEQNSSVEVSLIDCTIAHCPNYGIEVDGGANVHVEGCHFHHLNIPINIPCTKMNGLKGGNTYSATNTDNRIRVGGGVVAQGDWTTQEIPLHIVDDLSVFSNTECARLVLHNGAEWQMDANATLHVGNASNGAYVGTLDATGVTFRGTTQTPGFWRCIQFNAASCSTSVLNGCIIEDAGQGYNCALRIWASPEISNCEVRNSQGDGIYLNNGASPLIAATRITNCSGYPVSLLANDGGVLLPGNDFIGNGTDAIHVRGDVIEKSQIWQDPGVPWYISGDVSVFENGPYPHFQILPGNELQIAEDERIIVGNLSNGSYRGSLEAEGVLFTHAEAETFHRGITFATAAVDSLCVLQDCTVEYGGITTSYANICVYSSNPRLEGVVSRFSNTYGLKMDNGAKPTVEDCSFENNTLNPVVLYADDAHSLGAGNTYSGNGSEEIWVYGETVRTSQLWQDQGIPFFISSDVNVASNEGVELEITSGTELRFDTAARFSIGSVNMNYPGAMRASGVTFTGATASPGSWEGIYFYNSTDDAQSALINSVIEYAGLGGTAANVYLSNAAPQITGCQILHSSARGIVCDGAGSDTQISNCTISGNDIGVLCQDNAMPIIGVAAGNANSISGNTTWGVVNSTSYNEVDATHNWWGDAAGPSGEGSGAGDAVSTNVLFDPWRDTQLGDAPATFSLLSPEHQSVMDELVIMLDWERAIDPTPGDTVRYKLEISTDSGFEPGDTFLADSLLESRYQTSTELADDTRYFWRVTAYDEDQQQTYCNQQNWYFDTFVLDAPSEVSQISPSQSETVMLTSVWLEWSESVDADPGDTIEYTVYLAPTASFSNADSVVLSGTGVYTPFCAPGSYYYWKVKATDSYGLSSLSEIFSFFVHEDAGPRPINDLSITTLLPDQIRLDWSEIPGADLYHISRASDPDGSYTSVGSTAGLSWIDPDAVPPTGSRYYRVLAADIDLDLRCWRLPDGTEIPCSHARPAQ